jgi:16S rRNA C967 or C1407 C5-methylase (RsmB/RsmF family)
MVYATCSILKQESEDQVEKLIARGRDGQGAVLEIVPFIAGEIPGFDNAIDDNGWLRVLPGMLPGSLSNCDGFFVARLKRIE